MIYNDPLYGQIEFGPLATEIINNPGLQRLKKIHQNGANFFVNQNLTTSRFEHSLGVAALTKRFNRSQEETIAAIVHDISHTVFSHVVDIMLKRKNEDFHEDHHRTVLQRYGLDTVVQQAGLDPDYVFNENNFSVLERDQPDICADRLDYTLRDLYKIGAIDKQDIEQLLQGLTIKDGVIAAKNIAAGQEMLKRSIELNRKVFFRPIHEISNLMLSKILETALEEGIIEHQDLFSTDERVLNKINNSQLAEKLKKINPEVNSKEDNGEFYLHRKPRVIDPLVLVDGKKQRLSQVDQESKRKIERFEQSTPREVFYNLDF